MFISPSSGRPVRVARSDPMFAALVVFLLPDRNRRLEGVDTEATRRERFLTMRRRNRHGDTHLPHRDDPYPVDHGYRNYAPAARDLVEESGGADRFFHETLEPFAAIHAAIIAAQGPSPAISRYVGYLGWIGSVDWMPLLGAPDRSAVGGSTALAC